MKPTKLPSLDYSTGVPKESATFIVIPTILKNKENVAEFMKKLEVYYLANKSENLYFALLGDCKESKSEEESFDNEVIEEGRKWVQTLNKKYPSEEFPKFHFIYRKRTWNPKEKTYLGWERKRGLITQFNTFLLNPETNEFRVNTIKEQNKKIPETPYIITLDADTNLVLNSGLELIGTMAHILNKPILSKSKKIVEEGHAILQPRVGINLEAANSSYFSKIFAGNGGTDLYTNAVSDIYQDNFGEGIFTGKGIYDLKVFNKVLENQIPENTVLSHDLLEGSYLRAGLVTDILVLDGFPSKYNSFITRLARWTRGDWQISKWLGSTVVDKNGTRIKNPLSFLSKFKILDNLRRSIMPIVSLFAIFLGLAGIMPIWFLSLGIISIVMPSILEILNVIIFKKELETDSVIANRNFVSGVAGVKGSIIRGLLDIAFLPHKALVLLISIIKTIYRMTISKQNLLEWMTAEEAEKNAKTDLISYYEQMIIQVIAPVLFFLIDGIAKASYITTVIGTLLAAIWILAPFYAYEISKPIIKKQAILELRTRRKGPFNRNCKKNLGLFFNIHE